MPRKKQCNPPWFKFYPKDWLTSEKVMSMTPEQRGAYIQLLAHHSINGGLPTDESLLAILSGLDNRWETVGAVVMKCFQEMNGRLINKKLQHELSVYRKVQDINSIKGIKSGKARREAKKSGNHGSHSVEPKTNELEAETEVEKEVEKEVKHKSKTSCPKFEERHLELARRLSRLIRKHCPKNITIKASQGPQWANTFRLMEQNDGPHGTGLPLSEIEAVIDWAFTDDFWSAQIQSANSVRKHWNKLVTKMDLKTGNAKVSYENHGPQVIV